MDLGYKPRQDTSKVVEPGTQVALGSGDMRFLYRQLRNAVSTLVDPLKEPDAYDLAHAEVQRAFEMTRHSVKIDGAVIKSGTEFQSQCEETDGFEELDQELMDRVTELKGEIHAASKTLMYRRETIPLALIKKVTEPRPQEPLPELKIEAPVLDTELLDNARRSLESLNDLEKRINVLKKTKSALEYTI